MTELNQKNNEIFLDFCKNTWDFDDESLEYVKERISDSWEPVPEFKKLIKDGVAFEDQRLRFDVDLSNKDMQDIFIREDKSFNIFNSEFSSAIKTLRDKYNCVISYGDFLNNKVLFNKNVTKIKKVLEVVYKENNKAYEYDFSGKYNEEACGKKIVRIFEEIGKSKKTIKKYQLVISFNVVDWFLASTGGKISSCFNLDSSSGGYSFCLGLPFLCGDKNRAMIYLCNGDKKEWEGFKVDSPDTRTWCLLDKSDKISIVKWYPNNTVGVEPVNNIVKTNLFVSSSLFKEGKYPIDVLSTKKGMVSSVYNDIGKWISRDGQLIHVGGFERSGQQIFTKNLISCEDKLSSAEWRRPAPIAGKETSYHIPIWRRYGISVDKIISTYKCFDCGEDKVGFFIGKDSDYFCYSCYKEKVFTCSICGKQHVKSETHYHTVNSHNGTVVEICDECYKNISKYTCNCCGSFSKDLLKTADGKKICSSCVETEKYIKCDNCGSFTKKAISNYVIGSFEGACLCEECNTGFEERQSAKYFSYKKPFRVVSRTLNENRIQTE